MNPYKICLEASKKKIVPGEDIVLSYKGWDSLYFQSIEGISLEVSPLCDLFFKRHVFYPIAGVRLVVGNTEADELIFKARFKYRDIFEEEGEIESELKLQVKRESSLFSSR